MSDGFQVVMSDLQAAAAAFHSEASTFLAIMPQSPSGLPDGGSGSFNAATWTTTGPGCRRRTTVTSTPRRR
jgi:hypothetical protein